MSFYSDLSQDQYELIVWLTYWSAHYRAWFELYPSVLVTLDHFPKNESVRALAVCQECGKDEAGKDRSWGYVWTNDKSNDRPWHEELLVVSKGALALLCCDHGQRVFESVSKPDGFEELLQLNLFCP